VIVERAIRLDGCLNFRDLGGYPTEDGRTVRWRQLFRSDALHLVTPTDVACIRDQLGIGDVIDLRSSGEVRAQGANRLAAEPIRCHHVPLFDGDVRANEAQRPAGKNLADLYMMMAEVGRDAIGRVITTIATAPGPALFHCAAGKDRTGVVSAVLFGLLGVRDELIIADYVASRENLDAIVERLLASRGYQAMLAALPPDTMHAEPETMLAFLAGMRERHGSMRGFALAAGVAEESIARLVDRLLVRPAP
jgi:protein-tyrosine phosphatase